jgi:hypothetical protein
MSIERVRNACMAGSMCGRKALRPNMKDTGSCRLRGKRKVDRIDRRRGSWRPARTALECRLNACAQVGEQLGTGRVLRSGAGAGLGNGEPGQLALQRHRAKRYIGSVSAASGQRVYDRLPTPMGRTLLAAPARLFHRGNAARRSVVEHVVQHVLHPHGQWPG